MSTITLNVNGLNAPTKTQKVNSRSFLLTKISHLT